MTDSIECPRCAMTGLVSVENIIKGGRSHRSFHCNRCDHEWRVLETGEHVPSSSDGEGRPDRSRPHVDPPPASPPRRKSR